MTEVSTIQIHTAITTHRKFRKLAKRMGGEVVALGVLAKLWIVAREHSDGGVLRNWIIADIDDAIGIDGVGLKLQDANWISYSKDDRAITVIGWITWSAHGDKPGNVTTISESSLSARAPAKPITTPPPALVLVGETDDRSFTAEDLLAGKADHLKGRAAACEAVARALCEVHAKTWGGSARRRSTKARPLLRAMKAAFIDEKRKPSDLARACAGMRFDPWKERKNNTDWKFVIRHFDKWIDLYELNAENGSTTARTSDGDGWGPWSEDGFPDRASWEAWKRERVQA